MRLHLCEPLSSGKGTFQLTKDIQEDPGTMIRALDEKKDFIVSQGAIPYHRLYHLIPTSEPSELFLSLVLTEIGWSTQECYV